MNILFVGDVFGSIGRRILAERLPRLIEEHTVDFCIANGENSAGGLGITSNIYKKMRKHGVDVVSGGNHSFAQADHDHGLWQCPFLIRPLNLPPGNNGIGQVVFSLAEGRQVAVVNLLGRLFFHESMDCPFRAAQAAVAELSKVTPFIVVDMHAEATSEKIGLAHLLDGMVTAVVGTHTHVQTADERVLPKGTAFITDVGMTGPEDSIIGMKKEPVLRRFLLQTHTRLAPSDAGPMLNAVLIRVDDATGKARSIQRVFERMSFAHE